MHPYVESTLGDNPPLVPSVKPKSLATTKQEVFVESFYGKANLFKLPNGLEHT